MSPPLSSDRPQETLAQLCALLPSFSESWARENVPAQDGWVDGVHYEWSHHHVMRIFLEHFAEHHAELSEKQLKRIGSWLTQAVSSDSALENAVSTCFLEHMRDVGIERILKPHLSPEARRKSHA